MMGRPGGGMRGPAAVPRGGTARISGGTLRRLLRRLRPERLRIVARAPFGVVSVGFTVSGPRILGDATNVLFDGVIGKQLPHRLTKAQAIALLRAHGQGQIAEMISGMNVTPGRGVDIDELGRVLGLAAVVYLAGAAVNSARATSWQVSPSGRCSGFDAKSRRSCRLPFGTSTATPMATS